MESIFKVKNLQIAAVAAYIIGICYIAYEMVK